MRAHALRWVVILFLLISLFIAACGGGDSDPAAATTDVPPDAVATSTLDTQSSTSPPAGQPQLDGQICCGTRGEIDGQSYLFVMTLGGEEQASHGMLHILHIGHGGSLRHAGTIETPKDLQFGTLTGTSRIALSGDTLYLPVPGQDTSGLWVVDVSDPESPRDIAFIETELPPLSVAVSGDLAAVAMMSFNGPVLFFDISDPTNLRRVSEHEQSVTSLPPRIELVDSHLYVVDDSGVAIIDVTTPDMPQVAGEYSNPDWEGPLVAGGRSGSPTDMLDGVAQPDTFLDIAVSGQYLYIASSDSGLRVIDISDPANPKEVGLLELPGRAVQVAVSDNQVYVLGVALPDGTPPFRYNIHVIDASTAGEPQLGDTIEGPETMQPFQSMMVGSDATYVLDYSTVHAIRDGADGVATPSEPTGISPINPVGSPSADGPGISRGLSFDEAQEVTSFELIRPEPVPASLELIGIDVVVTTTTGTLESGMPYEESYLMYRLVDGEMPNEPITFKQSTLVGEVGHRDQIEVIIGSRNVTTFRTAENAEGEPLAVYVWQDGELSYMVSARLAGDVTEQHLEDLIAALPQ